QAEDGIRDFHVTGVQTCALPIWGLHELHPATAAAGTTDPGQGSCCCSSFPLDFVQRYADRPRRTVTAFAVLCRIRSRLPVGMGRSEERRVGKACMVRWVKDTSHR